MSEPPKHVDIVTPSPQGHERRAWVRFPCKIDTSCHSVGAASDRSWPATVKDLSAAGVGLALSRRFEPGTVLTVHLQNSTLSVSRTVIARVVRVRPLSNGEWGVGCEFANRLTDDELETLLS
jgi:hypothetical protein